MNNLLIGFQTINSNPSFSSKVMGKAVKSQIYHSELIFKGHVPERFSAWSDFGTGFRPSSPESVGDISKWIFFDLGTAHYQAALAFSESQVGKGYDFKSAVNQVMNRKNLNTPDRWYCSEVCHAALRYAGVPLLDIPSNKVLPPMLFTMFNSLYYPQIIR